MQGQLGILLVAVALAAFGLNLIWRPLRLRWSQASLVVAQRDFHRQRERLEMKFLALGQHPSRCGAPRWVDCDFEDDVAYARNRGTGELSAFVAVVVELEDPDSVPAGTSGIGAVRGGTAIFTHDGRRWDTEGRAVFNLSPTETLRVYRGQLELVARELA